MRQNEFLFRWHNRRGILSDVGRNKVSNVILYHHKGQNGRRLELSDGSTNVTLSLYKHFSIHDEYPSNFYFLLVNQSSCSTLCSWHILGTMTLRFLFFVFLQLYCRNEWSNSHLCLKSMGQTNMSDMEYLYTAIIGFLLFPSLAIWIQWCHIIGMQWHNDVVKG